nr:unnamed protein product [Callosobruchus analis]
MRLRRYTHCMTIYHKIIVNKKPKYLHRKIMFRTDVHNLNLRHRNQIAPPLHRTALFERSFSYCISKYYNLSSTLLSCSVSAFAKILKKLILAGFPPKTVFFSLLLLFSIIMTKLS